MSQLNITGGLAVDPDIFDLGNMTISGNGLAGVFNTPTSQLSTSNFVSNPLQVSTTPMNGFMGMLNGNGTFLGMNKQGWGNVLGLGARALSGLAGLYGALNQRQALKDARNQFEIERGFANRNLANQAKIINNTYENAARTSAALMGESTDSGLANQYARDTLKRYGVNGNPV